MPLYKRKTSILWNHFKTLEENKAKCGYCSAKLSFSGGSTSNLKRHLTAKHPTVPINRNRNRNTLDCGSNNDEPNESSNELPSTSRGIVSRSVSELNVLNQATTPSLVLPSQSTPSVLPSQSTPSVLPSQSTLSVLPSQSTPSVLPSQSTPSVLPSQRPVTDYLESRRPMTASMKKQLDEQLTKMIVKKYHPFSLVEQEEFRIYSNMLNPNYILPSRKTISNSIIPILYESTYNKIKLQIDNANAICLTTDCWTSINNTSFMAITGHFIDENMTFQSICMECEEFGERHTASNIGDQFKKTIEAWNISHKLIVIVSDNSANVIAGVRETGFRHLPCFAHSLNLVVQKGLLDIQSVTTKVKGIVQYFKSSSYALKQLHAIQKQMGIPVIKLKQNVITRWNSTYDMLERLINVKDAVMITLILFRSDMLTLSNSEWQIVEESLKVLRIFYLVTKEISEDQYVTLPSILIFIGVMTKTMSQYERDTSLPPMVLKMVSTIKGHILTRLKPLEDNELVTQAALLDPRFKKLAFSNSSSSKLTVAMDRLKQKVCSVLIPTVSAAVTEVAAAPQESTSSSSMLWQSFDRNYERQRASQNPQATGIVELDKYMNEPIIQRHENPLTWWNERKMVYPRLFHLVQRRLCITATSVPCEHLFSKTGNTITDIRSRLTSKKASQILFLNQNL